MCYMTSGDGFNNELQNSVSSILKRGTLLAAGDGNEGVSKSAIHQHQRQYGGLTLLSAGPERYLGIIH